MAIKSRKDHVNSAATLLGISAVARILERSENNVRHLANSNQLASIRDAGNRRLFTRDAVEKFLREQERATR